jgi:hypothetical protein
VVSEPCVDRTVVGTDTTDSTFEGCDWANLKDERILEFNGRSLVMTLCKFRECGSTAVWGGSISAQAFTGDLMFDSVEFLHVYGIRGTIWVESSSTVSVTLYNCSVLYGEYSERGFLYAEKSATGTQRLSLNVTQFSLRGVIIGNSGMGGTIYTK